MIYVIGMGTFADDESYELTKIIKIGYASDFRKRFNSYKAENPKPRVLFRIEGGNLHDEKRLHKYFKRFLFAGREWFTWEEEILEFFRENDTIEKIRDAIKDISGGTSRGISVSVFLHESLIEVLEESSPFLTKFMSRRTREFLSSDQELDKVVKYFPEDVSRKIVDIYNSKKEKYLANKSEVDVLRNEINELDDTKQSSNNRKLKLIVEYGDLVGIDLIRGLFPNKIIEYYQRFGAEEIKKNEYSYLRLRRLADKLNRSSLLESISDEIYSEFKVGDRLSKKEIKERLTRVCRDNGILNTVKATDLARWFEIKEIELYPNGERFSGFQILSKKSI